MVAGETDLELDDAGVRAKRARLREADDAVVVAGVLDAILGLEKSIEECFCHC